MVGLSNAGVYFDLFIGPGGEDGITKGVCSLPLASGTPKIWEASAVAGSNWVEVLEDEHELGLSL